MKKRIKTRRFMPRVYVTLQIADSKVVYRPSEPSKEAEK